MRERQRRARLCGNKMPGISPPPFASPPPSLFAGINLLIVLRGLPLLLLPRPQTDVDVSVWSVPLPTTLMKVIATPPPLSRIIYTHSRCISYRSSLPLPSLWPPHHFRHDHQALRLWSQHHTHIEIPRTGRMIWERPPLDVLLLQQLAAP